MAAGETDRVSDESGEVPRQRRKLSAILMADVSGFSRMMGRDEEGTTALIRDFHGRVRACVERHEGRVVDTAGDSVFGEFDSVVQAVRCAQAVQEEQAEANRERGDARIDTRIGVHLGDVIVEGEHVYGDGVNIAARLESLAEPGGIFVSEAVYQQVHNKLGLPFEDLGVRDLKNIEHPLRVFRVPPESLGHPPEVVVRDDALPVADSGAIPDPQPVRNLKRRPGPPAAPVAPGRWAQELVRPYVVAQLAIGATLLASELIVFPTGGVFPTAGAVLLATGLGTAWNRTSGNGGHLLGLLGVALVLGGAFTRWNPVTDGLFTLAGLLCISLGVVNLLGSRQRRALAAAASEAAERD